MATTTFAKKGLGMEKTAAAIKPPPIKPESAFKKPKLGPSQSRKKDIPEGV